MIKGNLQQQNQNFKNILQNTSYCDNTSYNEPRNKNTHFFDFSKKNTLTQEGKEDKDSNNL